MNNQPLISVIVPAYNLAHCITDCIDSIEKQTYSNFEIIIIDDGSTDETKNVCEKLAKTYSNIRVISQKNQGISAVRNLGIQESQGQYLSFIDGDDQIKETFLEHLYQRLIIDSSDIVVCGYQEIRASSCLDFVPPAQVLDSKTALTNYFIKQQDLDILIWNKLYKKSLFQDFNIQYPVGQVHEDNLTTYKLFAKAKKISFLDSVEYYYYRTNSNITANADSEFKTLRRLQAKLQTAAEAQKYLPEEYRPICEVAILLAKFAFMDASISGMIPAKNFEENRIWVKQNSKKFQFTKNPYLTKKLRLYLILLAPLNGLFYRVFRKIV